MIVPGILLTQAYAEAAETRERARAALFSREMMDEIRKAMDHAVAQNADSASILWDKSWNFPDKPLAYVGRLKDIATPSLMAAFKKAASDATDGQCRDVTFHKGGRYELHMDSIVLWRQPPPHGSAFERWLGRVMNNIMGTGPA